MSKLALPALIGIFGLLAGCQSLSTKSASTTAKPASGDQANASANKGSGTGPSRIDIKRAADPDAKNIDLSAKEVSVEDVLAMKLPDDFKGKLEDYTSKRIGPFEKSTYKVTANLKTIEHKKDGDYYMVLQGKSGASLVVEVPDPKLIKDSAVLSQITAAREELEADYHPTDKPQEINQPVTVSGVGFFGFKSKAGATGAGSPPRLMPGIAFKKNG